MEVALSTNYSCFVAVSGYEVKTRNAKQGLLEVEVTETVLIPKDAALGIKFIDLSKHPAAFKRFSVLRNAGDIVNFADRFGFLGSADDLLDCGLAEPLQLWLSEITAMRTAVFLWLATREKNSKSINNWITKKGNEYFLNYGEAEISISNGPYDKLTPINSKRDAAVAAYCAFAQARLSDSVTTSLFRDPVRASPQPQLTYMPKHLMAALWLQFALAVTNNQSFKACAECGDFFVVASKPRRFPKVYCSDRCRKRAERKRS